MNARVKIESDLEPQWTLISERAAAQCQTRNLNWADRLRLAPTRLGAVAEYNLSWRRGSILNKVPGSASLTPEPGVDAVGETSGTTPPARLSSAEEPSSVPGEEEEEHASKVPSVVATPKAIKGLIIRLFPVIEPATHLFPLTR